MFFILLFATAYAQETQFQYDSENALCKDFPYQTCKFRGSENFPETEREVIEYCRALVDHSNCWSNVLRVCDLGDRAPSFREVYDSGVFIDLCNKKYPLYNVLADNAKCIADTIDHLKKNGFCLNHIDALEQKPEFRSKIEDLHAGYEGESRMQLGNCVSSVFQVGCLGISLKNNCGRMAQNLMLWAVEKSGILKVDCKEEYETTVKKFVDIMELDMRK
ncbi:uncharacterized protein [Parasteatoda tepidariorum]|uniref:uncharacterized protein n=1 Tax=Parasteatoda tepidariorum TaxID=114398 RepID=UPI00077FA4F0|nr:uncharacterized protein LOC107454635 [Parasteatoda tepidariorum]